MSTQEDIQSLITQDLKPVYLTVDNESHMHSGPSTESHFKVTVVADKFADLPRVKRHQRIYGLLADQLAGEVHALALHLYTPDEWEEEHETSPDSPNCRGGSKQSS